MVLTIGVSGWCSAKARTGPGMLSVGTKAELMDWRTFAGWVAPSNLSTVAVPAS